jgi:FtsZ-interacting cell division protein YlmF
MMTVQKLVDCRTFVEMDSHEEKVYQAVRQTQEREAKQKMREKAKELQRQKIEMTKRGGRPMSSSSGGFGVGQMNSGGFSGGPSIGDSLSTPAEPPKPTYSSV